MESEADPHGANAPPVVNQVPADAVEPTLQRILKLEVSKVTLSEWTEKQELPSEDEYLDILTKYEDSTGSEETMKLRELIYSYGAQTVAALIDLWIVQSTSPLNPARDSVFRLISA